jgi:glycosyltransferase involved in cell wall biosynthesis
VPPLLSIITVNKDDRDGLARTLESVASQTFTDRELVVVDGASADGSVDLLRSSGRVVTAWVSEPDGGIYDAQNKGIARASGTYCLFLNAGDRLASPDALARVFAAAPAEDVVYGDVLVEEEGVRRLVRTPDAVTVPFLMRTTLPHQATLVRRALFARVGPYDPSFRIVADYEFFLRAIVVHGASTRRVPVPLAVQVMGGVSSRPESFPIWRAERARAREKALSPALRAFWDEYQLARRGRIASWLREAFRPLARRLRAASRSARGRPDSPI